MSQSPYTVLPSSGKYIRLLQVAPELEQGMISCVLQVSDLGSRPLFDCLSYTWDNPLDLPFDSEESQAGKHNPGHILCNGKKSKVTRNLLYFLELAHKKRRSHMRSADDVASPARPIWIDAICINQGDEEEKKTQVQMMGDIYDCAERVLIWLGPEDDHSRRATSVVNRLASVPKGISGLQYCHLDYDDPCPQLGIEPSISREEWCSYIAFLRRRWFSRVWVAQESYFANSIVVFIGETTIMWKNMVESARVLQETGLAEALQEMSQRDNTWKALITGRPTYSPDAEPNVPQIDSFSAMKSSLNNQLILTVFGRERDRVPFKLEKLLNYACYLDASDAHDKVFGLRGIWQHSPSTGSLAHLVPVEYQGPEKLDEYQRSVVDTFMNATYAAIIEMKDLNVLRLAGQPPSIPVEGSTALELPSWVPDYTRGLQLHSITVREDPSSTGKKVYGIWRADGSSRPRDWPLDILDRQSKCLAVKGALIEIVDDIGPSYREIDMQGLHHLFEHFNRYPSALSPYGQDFTMAWLQTLVAGKYRDQPAGREAVRAFHDLVAWYVLELEVNWENSQIMELPEQIVHFEKVHGQYKRWIEHLSAAQSKYDIFPTWEEVGRWIEIASRYPDCPVDPDDQERREIDVTVDAIRESFDRAYKGRRVFRTSGNFWGITSEHVKKGDHVSILSGADTPYVLRRGSLGWKLIGEAYVHGIMYGEAAKGPFEDMKLE
ncbi:heterokaryon incompatibility protein-domain-containing protein [Xylaria sp. FL1042]|nr:heterokaryon incompatibility protein-domain-containing protein [Xylaria sp. FL1042]